MAKAGKKEKGDVVKAKKFMVDHVVNKRAARIIRN